MRFSSMLMVPIVASKPFQAVMGNVTMEWSVNQSAIVATVSAPFDCWIGVGWHPLGSTGADDHDMFNVDFTIMEFISNQAVISDRFSNDTDGAGYVPPILDTLVGGTDDIHAATGSQVNGVTTYHWTKLLQTKDAKADHPIVASKFPGDYHLVYAHGDNTQNSLQYHGPGNRDHWIVNFLTGANEPCTVLSHPPDGC